MTHTLVYTLGILTGIVLTLAWQEARESDRLAALRGKR